MLKNIDLFLLDLDGTMYTDGRVTAGAAELISRLKGSGKRFCFLTNNSSRSAADYLLKLRDMGFAVTDSEVMTSGQSAILYLKKHHKGQSVFVLGTSSFKKELEAEGITVTHGESDIVLVSYDTELIYERLCSACLYISRGARYYVTHPDINCPSLRGMLPDAGSFISLIKTSTGKEAEKIFGKPDENMADAVSERFKIDKNKICMVGDRLSTDIAFAKNNGFKSVLVLSGETDSEMYNRQNIKADLVLPSVKELAELI